MTAEQQNHPSAWTPGGPGRPRREEDEWVTLPGGELQVRRRRTLCAACRAALEKAAGTGVDTRRTGTLCFECHRAEMRREQALQAAGEVFTGSPERFQTGLPFEPVDRARLARLRAERTQARQAARSADGGAEGRRRRAQIEARHALQTIAAGLRARRTPSRELEAATHAAELQLPESWLPFVVGR
jgi:hypothetical protein